MLQTDSEGKCDADFICEFLRKHKYTVRHYKIQAPQYGSVARRERIYWLAWFDGCERYADEAQQVLDVMGAAKHNRSLDTILVPSADRTCEDRTPVHDNPDKTYKYKDDHMKLFEENTLAWPADRSAYPSLSHLDQRPYECAWFAMKRWPHSGADGPDEFMDLNLSLTRSCGPKGDKNPWSTTLNTFTCGGVYVFRRWCPQNRVTIRQLDGLELLQGIGFDRSFLKPPADAVPGAPLVSHRFATKLAGNAFSAYSVGAALVALLLNFTKANEQPIMDVPRKQLVTPETKKNLSDIDISSDTD